MMLPLQKGRRPPVSITPEVQGEIKRLALYKVPLVEIAHRLGISPISASRYSRDVRSDARVTARFLE